MIDTLWTTTPFDRMRPDERYQVRKPSGKDRSKVKAARKQSRTRKKVNNG